MPKRLPVQGHIQQKLSEVLGPGFDASKIAVYETIAVDTLPLNAGGLFQQATMSHESLQQMLGQVQKENFVPLHTMHLDHEQLPVGRVFDAKLVANADTTQLRTLFYLPLDAQEGIDLAKKIDNGVINDVSVGVMPSSAKCSECGFDYFGPEADLFNLFFLECNNDHVIGQDGTHVQIDGVKHFFELSLVGNGASENATIQDQANSVFQRESMRMAASASPKHIMIASVNKEKVMKLSKSQVKSIRAKLEKKAAGAIAAKHAATLEILAKFDAEDITQETMVNLKADFEAALQAHAAEEAAAKEAADKKDDTAGGEGDASAPADGEGDPKDGEGEEEATVSLEAHIEVAAERLVLQRRNEVLSASLKEANEKLKAFTVSQEKFDKLKLSADKAMEFLKLELQRVLILSGETNPTLPDNLEDVLEKLKTAQASIKGKLPVGGVAQPASVQAASGESKKAGSLDAYRKPDTKGNK